jgi:hypothetical protein
LKGAIGAAGLKKPTARAEHRTTRATLATGCSGTIWAKTPKRRYDATTMFVRFRKTRRHLQASLIVTRRAMGKIRHEHVAGLGSVPHSPSAADRIALRTTLSQPKPWLSHNEDGAPPPEWQLRKRPLLGLIANHEATNDADP